ncbi:MAG: hypothetical protein K940chlam5_00941, partial [Candidatus Anoxychlamydiales bacterium]|nr:hypothetical protein [Candidatus Anoxychlamydiales bacterium]
MDYYYQPPKIELVQYVTINKNKFERTMQSKVTATHQKSSKSEEDVKREVRDTYQNAAKGKNQNKNSKNNCCGGSCKP